jgi:hypothetical protein
MFIVVSCRRAPVSPGAPSFQPNPARLQRRRWPFSSGLDVACNHFRAAGSESRHAATSQLVARARHLFAIKYTFSLTLQPLCHLSYWRSSLCCPALHICPCQITRWMSFVFKVPEVISTVTMHHPLPELCAKQCLRQTPTCCDIVWFACADRYIISREAHEPKMVHRHHSYTAVM